MESTDSAKESINSGFDNSRGNLVLWIIVAAALLLRWTHLLIISGTDLLTLPIIDAAFYHQWAAEISSGNVIGQGVFFMSPLYPYLTGLLYTFFGTELWIVFAFQGLLGAGTVWLLFRWTNHAYGRRTGFVAAGIAALYGPYIFYDSTLLTSSLIVFLSVLILNFAQEALDGDNNSSLWKLGAVIGLSSLARPLVLIFIPFLFLGFYLKNRSTSLRKTGFVLLAAVIIILPVSLRNLFVGGELTMTTSSAGMNFYAGNNSDATGLYWEAPFLSSVEPQYEDEEYRKQASQAVERDLTTREAGRYWARKAIEWIILNPVDYIKLQARKAFYFWNRAEFANNVSYYVGKAESPVLRFNPISFWLIGPLGLAGLILMWKRLGWRRSRLPWLWIAAYFCGAMLFFTASEYRLPITLALIVGTGYLAVIVYDQFKSRQVDSALKLLAFGIIFLPVTNIRTDFIRNGENPRMDYFNFGNTLLKHGKNKEAIPRFERVLEVDPYFEEGIHRLADAYYRAGMPEKVVEIGKRVKLKNPETMLKIVKGDALREAYALLGEGRLPEAMTEFGVAGWDREKAAAETTRVSRLNQAQKAFQEGRLDLTVELFRKIRAEDVTPDPSVSHNIAVLYLQMGKLDSAEFYATEALSIDTLDVPSVYLLAKIYKQTDRREEAENLLRRVNPDADTHQALLNEVRTEMDSLTVLGKWEDALEAYARYGKLGYESDPEDKFRLGRLQIEVGNIELALRLLTEAEDAGIYSTELYYHRGRALTLLNRIDEGMEAFRSSVAADPDYVPVRIELARIYSLRQDVKRALKELDAVSHLDIIDPVMAEQFQRLKDDLVSRQ